MISYKSAHPEKERRPQIQPQRAKPAVPTKHFFPLEPILNCSILFKKCPEVLLNGWCHLKSISIRSKQRKYESLQVLVFMREVLSDHRIPNETRGPETGGV